VDVLASLQRGVVGPIKADLLVQRVGDVLAGARPGQSGGERENRQKDSGKLSRFVPLITR
jgi:hypothetical protein